MTRHTAIASLATAVLTLTFAAALGAGSLVFTDVTPAGIAAPATQTESLAWGDYDDDGDPDLYLTNLGANKLWRNDGGGVFTDVTDVAGVGHEALQVGAAWGDFDNDGDLDLYLVTFSGGQLDILYRNDGPIGPGGEHLFTDVAESAPLDDESSIRGVTLLDYDRDGLLDVYVNAGAPDIVYRNEGGFTFSDVGFSLGVVASDQGVGAVASDIDGNGWIDVFAGNRNAQPNRLFLNDGSGFLDMTAGAGIDEVGLGMGVLSFDYDNDLDFDLYWTTWPGVGETPQDNALYQNLGGTLGGIAFANVTAGSGLADPLGWGISCNPGDLDNDGWEDLAVTNGADPSSTPSVIFRNQGATRGAPAFADVTAAFEGGMPADGRGVAFADYDGDGDLDMAITGAAGSSTRLWRNDTDNGNRWLILDLRGTSANRAAIGARVEVETALRTVVKEVSGGAGRGSQNDLPLEFGLGTAPAVVSVTIRWPSNAGHVTKLYGLAVDRKLQVVESTFFASGFETGDTVGWDLGE